MKRFRSLLSGSIGVRITVSIVLIVAISMGTLSWLAVSQASRALNEKGMCNVKGSTALMYSLCELQREVILAKLKSDLRVAEGAMAVEAGDMKNWENELVFTDQQKKIGKFTVPVMKIGGQLVTGDYKLVDSVLEQTGSTCTVFQVLPDQCSIRLVLQARPIRHGHMPQDL